MDKDLKTRTRFWKKVDVKKDNECWEWTASKNKKGYGEFWLENKPHFHAHKVAWILTNGDISDEMCVCHTCDNPSCCNPNHLFLGTNQDNVDDKMKKGRWNSTFLYGKDHPQHGGNSPYSKLTESDVREIRNLREQGYTLRALAKQFGVTHGVINNILQGRKWAWLK